MTLFITKSIFLPKSMSFFLPRDGPQSEHSKVYEFIIPNSLNMTTLPVDSLHF